MQEEREIVDLARKARLLGEKVRESDRTAMELIQALQERRELKRKYLDVEWKEKPRRFRLDSASGSGPTGKVWGTLFLPQEASRPSEGGAPPA